MYNAHFKFRESPFGVTPDPQFYYSNAVNREAWATLRYGIEERKGFIAISGEPGTGKTTLLRKALHSLRSNIETAYICRTLVNYTELLELILNDLGLPTSGGNTSSMVERLYQYSIEQFKKQKVVALLIDEAQDLSVQCLEELRLLGNLETEKNKLLQIVLVGQPELEQKLDRPELLQLKQRVALRCRLEPVRIEEVGPYIESRLQTIGRSSAEVFDPKAIEKIALYSKGIPRLINIICNNALLIAYALSKFKVSADMVNEAADDLLIGKSRIEQGTHARALTSPIAEKESLQSPSAKADDLTTKEEPYFIEYGDHAAAVHKDSKPSTRGTHRWFRPLIGTSAAIVVLTGLGAFLYAFEWGLSFSGSSSDIASQTSSLLPNTTYSALRSQILAVSAHTPSTQPLEKTASGTEKSVTMDRLAKPVIDAEVQKPERAARGDNNGKSTNSKSVFVVGPSFVRAKPTNDAAIIATLEPGTRITVAGRTGEYYRIRSLGTETINGYVHKEDAFFERKS